MKRLTRELRRFFDTSGREFLIQVDRDTPFELFVFPDGVGFGLEKEDFVLGKVVLEKFVFEGIWQTLENREIDPEKFCRDFLNCSEPAIWNVQRPGYMDCPGIRIFSSLEAKQHFERKDLESQQEFERECEGGIE